jgi:adenosylcobinamide-GDP ribazoletransferase
MTKFGLSGIKYPPRAVKGARGVFFEISLFYSIVLNDIKTMKNTSFIKHLTAACSYLTIFFPRARPKKLPVDSLAYFPVVGLLLGCLLWFGAFFMDTTVYPVINALVLVSLLTIATRGLPLDGLASLLDGLAKGGTAKEIGKVIQKGARGSAGVIGIALALLAKYLLMSQLIEEGAFPSLLLFPTLGRWSMVCLTWFFPEQQEQTVANPPASRDLWWAAAVALLCALLTQGLTGLGIVVLVWIFTYALGRYCIKKIGGITAPVMAAAAELTELLSLAICVALLSTR